MPKLSRIIIICGVFTVFFNSGSVIAAEPTKAIPNLIGKWAAEHKVYLHKGHKTARGEFNITEQDGPHFRGIYSWKDTHAGDPVTTKKGKLIAQDSEPFVGVIGFDGKSITIVEHGDGGTVRGVIVDKDTMQVVYSEPGANAIVFRMELKRQH